MKKGLTKQRVWLTRSSSGPAIYETVLWSDDTLSCNCPGWTRRVAKDGSRDCKHLRAVAGDLRSTLRVTLALAMQEQADAFAGALDEKVAANLADDVKAIRKRKVAAQKAWKTRKANETISYKPTTEPPENRRRVFFTED